MLCAPCGRHAALAYSWALVVDFLGIITSFSTSSVPFQFNAAAVAMQTNEVRREQLLVHTTSQ